MRHTPRPLRLAAAATLALSSYTVVGTASAATQIATAEDDPSFTEPYRPKYHYTPARNWMNDPNGLVYHDGEYHLFYQYNPEGNTWGHMSWGHAVSTDLVHWKELPLAIPEDDEAMIFSGSAVVDHQNTTGFGTKENPAMVAVYTMAMNDGSGKQAQGIAYSLDNGRSWTKYEGNPVLDIDSREFRDPKVQWYEPTQSWLMTVSKSTEHKVAFYSSKDLKHWTHLSDFGPAGATGGVWECPDLFQLPVEGRNGEKKWVLVVNLNPGGIAGGSAAQYFVGDFDGTTFTPDDDGSYEPPAGLSVLEDFESTDFGDWTVTGEAFGSGPAQGGAEGTDQTGVTGYLGDRLANSFHGYDASTGTLTSPTFTVDKPYLNFLVGGGNHPHDPEAVLNPPAPTPASMIADFEGGAYGEGWTITGEAFGTAPATGTLPGQQNVSGYEGEGLVNTFIDGDSTVGTLTSPEFTITNRYINFLIGGGRHPMSAADPTAVNLIVNGEVVRTATGSDGEHLNWSSWDVSELLGQNARLEVVDRNTGGWGHINLDSVMLSDTQAQKASSETTANLVVDGEIVESATGSNSGTLDWTSFDLRPYAGKQAQVKLIDANTGGWGQVLADHFTFADEPARSAVERADWVDYGKDYYAAVSWDEDPNGRNMIGWMNNWQYAQGIPTSSWRSAMSIPRTMSLRDVDGEVRLMQRPVDVDSLREGRAVEARNRVIPPAAPVPVLPPGAGATAYELDVTFDVGDAETFGLRLRTGPGEQTVVGYDTANSEMYVDRTDSGVDDFSSDFPGVQRAPLAARDGKVHLRILVDEASVEVFGGDGESVITDQIFPDPNSDGVELFATGGNATADTLKLWRLGSYR